MCGITHMTMAQITLQSKGMKSFIIIAIIPILIFAWYWLFFRKFMPDSHGMQSSSRDLAFPFIESYLFYKSAALKSAKNGEGAENYINNVLGRAANDLPKNSDVEAIFNKFLEVMTSWSKKVDKNLGNTRKLSQASEKLEEDIDKVAVKCEALGWKFSANWRLSMKPKS